MPNSELILIAIALAMDAFAVSIATGVALKSVSLRQTFRLSWHFGLFQGLMPILGWYCGLYIRTYVETYAHWIAFVLLGYIGIKMIREAFDDDDTAAKDPTRGLTMVMLSIATSIDALAVGLSLSMLGLSVWYPALIIGIVALVFTAVGIHLGATVSRAKRFSKYAELVGGIVLIGIGVKILWERNVFG
ncbi:manganese efflux pump MntP [Salidesulfovibrio brasiliensis]|uniref:manganese efflux pump MntP n=1 Tax=Salidesulfovibrio brasiliensis TaxID=221711 RepID=UPI0006CF6938|nr:manganese efflux pump MntP family protein [Salidesulfovibrio brasiliensis]